MTFREYIDRFDDRSYLIGKSTDQQENMRDIHSSITSKVIHILLKSTKKTIMSIVLTVDGSPGYLWHYKWKQIPINSDLQEPKYIIPHTLVNILPNAKFIVMLRDPVERFAFVKIYFIQICVSLEWFKNKISVEILIQCQYFQNLLTLS